MATIEERPEFSAFGPHARRVLDLAVEEAGRLEHAYIGTEHILLGLLRGGNIAGQVLAQVGADADRIREEIEDVVHPASFDGHTLAVGPRARELFKFAQEEFSGLAQEPLNFERDPSLPLVPRGDHIETEHLLLGLLRVRESLAQEVLESLGISFPKVCEALGQALGQGVEPQAPADSQDPDALPE